MFVVFLIKKKKLTFQYFRKTRSTHNPPKNKQTKKRRRVTTPGRLTKVVTHGSSLNARFFWFLRFLFFFFFFLFKFLFQFFSISFSSSFCFFSYYVFLFFSLHFETSCRGWTPGRKNEVKTKRKKLSYLLEL